jgi:PAS domain-containing protein
MRASAYVLRILIVVFGVAFLLNVGLAAKSTSTSVNALDALSQAGVLAALCAPLLYAWVLRDQAKRLSEASAAREGRAKFRALLDSIAEIAVIVDSDGRITDMNRMAEAVFGYEHTELLNQPIEYLMPERFREAHVAQRESYMANPRRMPLGSGRELSASAPSNRAATRVSWHWPPTSATGTGWNESGRSQTLLLGPTRRYFSRTWQGPSSSSTEPSSA